MLLITYRLRAAIATAVGCVEESSDGECGTRESYHHGIEFSILGSLKKERVLGVVHEIIGPTTTGTCIVIDVGDGVPSKVPESVGETIRSRVWS